MLNFRLLVLTISLIIVTVVHHILWINSEDR